MSKLRLNVQDAAEVIGISVDAVRMRARRGSLVSVHENGRLYVWLDNDETGVNGAAERVRERVQNIVERDLIEDLREQVSFLRAQLQEEREENRRKDHLLAAALERIPAIEAPPEATGGSETSAEEPYSTHVPPEGQGQQGPPRRRSWWREFFGLE